jgi:hypothetical protein
LGLTRERERTAYRTYGQGQAVALDWPLTVELDITRIAQPPS